MESAFNYPFFMELSALSFRDFRVYVGGNVFALNALWMQRITIGWIAWELTSSATFVGFIAFINFAPSMIMGPLFGVLIDRVQIKKAALVTQFLLFLISLSFYLFFTFGLIDEIVLAILAASSGIIASAYNPVRMSLGPRLVSHASISSVVTIGAINFNLARLIGPAIGGWLITVWGVGIALLIQTLCYLPFIFALSLLRPRELQPSTSYKEPFLSALKSGIQHVAENSFIGRALLITALFAFLIRGTLEILPVIADGVFSKGAVGLGLLTSSAGLGALLAGLAKVFMPNQSVGEIPKAALLSTLAGISLIPVVGFSNEWELTIGCIACLGFASTLSAITLQTAIQIDLDDNLRGRVMSIWVMVSIGAAATGALIMGGLADYIGFPMALGLAGSLGILILVISFIRRPKTLTDSKSIFSTKID